MENWYELLMENIHGLSEYKEKSIGFITITENDGSHESKYA